MAIIILGFLCSGLNLISIWQTLFKLLAADLPPLTLAEGVAPFKWPVAGFWAGVAGVVYGLTQYG
jgi:hypothetical protein